VTPYEVVASHYQLPFPLYQFQQGAVNTLANADTAGLYLDVGTGKTATATALALYRKHQHGAVTVAVMPPILVLMWLRWLRSIPGITAVAYRGTPKQRAEINLDGVDFVLMGIQIFKKDYPHLFQAFRGKPITLLVDEAQSVKNVSSDNHQSIHHFHKSLDTSLMLLTGTPLSKPIDGYAYCKLVAPGTYRNLRHFENLHVAERDFFGEVSEWKNLELLRDNMKINAVRVLREEALKELPEILYIPLYYELEKEHYKLYEKLANEELLELADGGKLDATNASALVNALAQIICNYGHFAEEPGKISAGIHLLDQVMQELGDKKLVVVANYRMTNRQIVTRMAKYNAVAIYGDLTTKQQNASADRFIADPACRMLVINPSAGGVGLNGLQDVCHDMLFLEMPTVPGLFAQVVARLQRGGQKNQVSVRMAIAEGTLQVRRFNQLMDNDTLINTVIRSHKDLKDAIFGR
jgi:SNF2 family DNA or RNA helicase